MLQIATGKWTKSQARRIQEAIILVIRTPARKEGKDIRHERGNRISMNASAWENEGALASWRYLILNFQVKRGR